MGFSDCKTDKQRVNYFKNLWERQGRFLSLEQEDNTVLSTEQRDRIGVAYLEQIIGADSGLIEGFIDIRHPLAAKARHFVGMRQATCEPLKGNYEGFWSAVKETVPSYSPEEIDWLIRTEDPNGVNLMLFHLGGSYVLSEIATNAHAYK